MTGATLALADRRLPSQWYLKELVLPGGSRAGRLGQPHEDCRGVPAVHDLRVEKLEINSTVELEVEKMPRLSITIAAFLLMTSASQADEYVLNTFTKIRLTDKFWSEAATFGDINRDGHNDIVAGPYWYQGPDYKKRHAYSSATQTFKRKRADGTEETTEGYEGALGSG